MYTTLFRLKSYIKNNRIQDSGYNRRWLNAMNRSTEHTYDRAFPKRNNESPNPGGSIYYSISDSPEAWDRACAFANVCLSSTIVSAYTVSITLFARSKIAMSTAIRKCVYIISQKFKKCYNKSITYTNSFLQSIYLLLIF